MRSIFSKFMLPTISIVFVVAFSILIITGNLFSTSYEFQLQKQNEDTTKFISQSVETFMDKAYSLTEEMALSSEILTMSTAIQTPVIQEIAERNPYFELVYVQDMGGDQTARSTGDLGNRASRWWFQQMLELKEPFVSKSYYSVSTDMTCASVFYPLYKNGRMIGIFATDIKLTTLQEFVEEFSNSESGLTSYIIDGEGNVVAHPENVYYEELYNYKNMTRTVTQKDDDGNTLYDDDGNILTEELPIEISKEYSDLIGNVMTGETGYCEITDGGKSYFVSYAPIHLKGTSDSWSVVTLQDKDIAFSQIYSINRIGIIVTVICLVFAAILIGITTNSVSKPIKLSHNRLRQLTEGDLTTVMPQVNGHDECAELVNDLNKTIGILKNIIEEIQLSVEKIAQGDFTYRSKQKFNGDFQLLATSLSTVSNSMGSTLAQISDYSEEFSAVAHTFDTASQSLAQGTTSQASAIEEVTSTLANISENVTLNAVNAKDVDSKMLIVKDELAQSTGNLHALVAAMKLIETNSLEISNISKLVQDIAFTTNLLSMNASVEATRAGEAGKGFAVVASEIRELAAKCNDAAVSTAELIEKTHKNIKDGISTLNSTVSSIEVLTEQSTNTARLISDISNASGEQAEAIAQIRKALEQISLITQNSSATAMESAGASNSMKEQAEDLQYLLSQYKY